MPFNCIASPKEKIEITPILNQINPISEIPALTEEILKIINNLEISNEKKNLLEEVFRKGKILFENFSKLNQNEKILLSYISGITKLFNKEESPKDISLLVELINLYVLKTKKIEWNKFSPIAPIPPATPLIVPVQTHNSNVKDF